MSIAHHHHFEELASTNDKALELARAGAETGTAVTAARQTAGRGRHGRVWETPEGSLALSLLHRPSRDLQEVASLTPCVAVGLTRALAQLGVAPHIKWPNDLLLGGQKVAGILCELHDAATNPVVIVGVGLNVDVAAFPDELREIATSLVQHGGTTELATVTEHLVREIRRMLIHHDRGGEVPAEFQDLMLGIGEPIEVTSGSSVLRGTLLGVRASDGALRVAGPDGEELVTSGEVSLHMG